MKLEKFFQIENINLIGDDYRDLDDYLYSDEFEEENADNYYVADYLPERIDDFSEYSKKEIYFDGISKGDVLLEEYINLENRYIHFVNTFFSEDSILLTTSMTVNNRMSNKVLGKSIGEINLPSLDIEDTDILNKSDDLLKLALAERAYIILIHRTKEVIMFINGFHCQTVLLDNSIIDDLRSELNKFNLFLWKNDKDE